MTRHKRLATAILAAALGATALGATGCGPAYVEMQATTHPRLVWVEPGIWIVENYPYAVYYSDGYYWRHVDGVWFRSSYYDGGFARVGVGIVPRVVVGAYRPAHVHYRAPAHVHHRPIVRDHRTPRRRR